MYVGANLQNNSYDFKNSFTGGMLRNTELHKLYGVERGEAKPRTTASISIPRAGVKGEDSSADTAACRNSMAECGTENGCANAWNALPHVICHGAMYVTTNCT